MVNQYALLKEQMNNAITEYLEGSDKMKMENIIKQYNRGFKTAIREDKTGAGFIRDMFSYELKNHEFGYVCDDGLYYMLKALGYSAKKIKSDKRLYNGLRLAAEEILRKEEYSNPEITFKRTFEYALEQGY